MFEPIVPNIMAWAQVIEAVRESQKVVAELPGIDMRIEGTLRHLSPESGSAAHAPWSQDVTTTYVRITTVQGFEIWVMTEELVAALADGAAGFR